MSIREQLKNLFPDHIEQDIDINTQTTEQTKKQNTTLICKYEKKGRNGKPVTIIEGLQENTDEIKKISKKIKTTLAIGGTEKNGTIIIQGDNRNKIIEILQNMGYKTKKVGG